MSKEKKERILQLNIGKLMDTMVIVTTTNITPEQEKAIEQRVADVLERAIKRVSRAVEGPVRDKADQRPTLPDHQNIREVVEDVLVKALQDAHATSSSRPSSAVRTAVSQQEKEGIQGIADGKRKNPS